MESWKDTGKESWKAWKAGKTHRKRKLESWKAGKGKKKAQWISRLIGEKIANRIRVLVMKIS